MRPNDIQDMDIPTADPEALISQYEPLLYKIAKRYENALEYNNAVDADDLLQAGRIAIIKAQKVYDPEGGISFLNYVFDWIRSAMRRTAGYKRDGTLPEMLISLNELLSDDDHDGATILDTIPDPHPTREEELVEEARKEEIRTETRAAVDRIRSDKQREAIRRVWLAGQTTEEAAADMGIKTTALRALDRMGRVCLAKDKQLRNYATPFIHVGVERFHSTLTSAVEETVIWHERVYNELHGAGMFLATKTAQAEE